MSTNKTSKVQNYDLEQDSYSRALLWNSVYYDHKEISLIC